MYMCLMITHTLTGKILLKLNIVTNKRIYLNGSSQYYIYIYMFMDGCIFNVNNFLECFMSSFKKQ